MASFKEMTKDGTIKRADRHQLRWEDIHIEPGFNAEGRLDDDDPDNISLLAYIMGGGMAALPALEVRPRAEGGVWAVDGHRRHKFIGVADRKGADLRDVNGNLWVDVKQFQGDDADRVARIVTSQDGKKLTPLQLGQIYKRLRGFNKSPDEIARIVHKTRQHVDQMLVLADANHDVKEAVKAGDISATEAVKLQRQHGDNTGKVIRQVKGDTGKKVTAKAVKPWTPPAKFVAPVISTLDALHKTMPGETRMAILNKPADGTMISIPATALWELMQHHDSIAQQRDKDAQRQREKQNQEKQQDLATGTDGA